MHSQQMATASLNVDAAMNVHKYSNLFSNKQALSCNLQIVYQ